MGQHITNGSFHKKKRWPLKSQVRSVLLPLLMLTLVFCSGCSEPSSGPVSSDIENSHQKQSSGSSAEPFIALASSDTASADPVTTAASAEAATPSTWSLYYRVVRVIDGDTIKVDILGKIESVRLIGVDTPETVDRRKPVQCFGKEAAKFTTRLTLGKVVSLEGDPTQADRDKFGRLLRYVHVQRGAFLNKELIAQGYAFEYTYNIPYAYQDEFMAAEKNAREAGRGLWSKDTCSGKP